MIPRFSFRQAAPAERIAELSFEAQELFRELCKPSRQELLPGLRSIQDGTEHLIFEFAGIPGIAACLKSRTVFIIDSFNERPPTTPKQVSEWSEILKSLSDGFVKLIALNMLEAATTMIDLNHRPFYDAFAAATGDEIKRLTTTLNAKGPDEEADSD